MLNKYEIKSETILVEIWKTIKEIYAEISQIVQSGTCQCKVVLCPYNKVDHNGFIATHD